MTERVNPRMYDVGCDQTRQVTDSGPKKPLSACGSQRSQRRALASVLTLMPADDSPADVREWILTSTARLLEVVHADEEVWRPVLGLTQNAPAVVRDRIAGTKTLIHGYLTDALTAGLAQTGEGAELDVDVLAHLLMATGEHFCRLTLEEPDVYHRDRLVTAMTALLPLPAASGRPPRKGTRAQRLR